MSGLRMKYFVLNPNKKDPYGAASRAAIRAYSAMIRSENSTLASDLHEWIEKIEGKPSPICPPHTYSKDSTHCLACGEPDEK
jgi:hypothetical protein